MRTYTKQEIAVLQEYLSYDAETGKFFWIKPRGTKVRSGDEAGTVASGFYRSILFDGKMYRCHRLAYTWVHGEFDGSIDHIDGNRQNNAISNLRLIPKQAKVERSGKSATRSITKAMISELKTYLRYEPDTGLFFYTIDRKRAKAGDVAGKIKNGYRLLSYRQEWWQAHRVAFAWDKGELITDLQIDHIDGDGTNNRLSNLRLATPSQNNMNVGKIKSNSGIKGIHFDERFSCYNAQVMVSGKPITGRFKTLTEAERWVKRTRESLHKKFANHGVST